MRIKKKLLNQEWFLWIALLSFFPPEYLNRFAAFDSVSSISKLAASLVISLFFVTDIKTHFKEKFFVLFFAMWIELLFSTLISNDASLYGGFVYMIKVIPVCIFAGEVILYAPIKGLKCLYGFFSLLIIINTATIFIFPNAMYPNNGGRWVCWFLGEDNGGYFYYIIASILAMLYCHYCAKKVTLIAVIDWISAFIFVFHNDIATGILSQILWLFLVVGYQFKGFKKLLKARYALCLLVGGFIALVLLRQFIFASVIEKLGRDITLSHRTHIWDRTIRLIMKRPVFGYGICDGDLYANMIGMKGITMAHNWMLIQGFNGGIVAIILYVMQVIAAIREARSASNTAYYRCLVIGLIVIYFRSLVEGGERSFYYLFLVMLNYSKEFLDRVSSETQFTSLLKNTRMGKYKIRLTLGRR